MKKNYLSMLFAMVVLFFATGTNLFADNVLSIGNVTGQAGETVPVTISLANQDQVAGFQVDVTLPEQATYVDGSIELTDRASSEHVLTANFVSSGALRILVYSMPISAFSGDNGGICTFNIVLGEESGDYPIELSGAVLSTPEAQPLPVTTSNGVVTIEGEPAGNVLSIDNYQGQVGEILTIGVNMENTDVVAGIQFDIVLPAEVTYVEGTAALTDRASATHILVAQMVNETTLRVLTYAMPLGEFSGNDGDVFTFDVVLGNTNGTYPIQLTEAVLSDLVGTTLLVSEVDGSITIEGDTPPVPTGNTMVLPNVTGDAGATVEIAVAMNNSDAVAGFQLEIPMNPNFSYVEGSIALTDRASNHTINAGVVDGVLRVIAYSMPPTAFVGNEGDLFTFDIVLGNTPGTYQLEMTNVILSDLNANQLPFDGATNGSVTIQGDLSENVLTMSSVTGAANSQVEFSVSMDNIDEVVGFQLDVVIPDGFSYVENSFELSDRASANHISYVDLVCENTLRVLVYSMPGTVFTGNSGELFTFDMIMGSQQGTYPIVMTDAVLSGMTGEVFPVSTVNGNATVQGGAPSQNTMMVSNEEGFAGDQVTFSVSLDNVDAVSGFQFDIVLPQEVSYVDGSAALTARATSNHQIAADVTGNVLRVIVFSVPAASFTGSTGAVVTFDVELGANGGTFPMNLQNVILADMMGSQLNVVEVDGTVTINGEIAGNVMSASDEIGQVGQTVTFSVSVDNEDEFVGFQTDVILPEGVEFIDGSVMLTNRASSNHYLYAQLVEGGALRVLSYSMPGTAFTGNSGAIFTFQATITTAGIGTYPIVLTGSDLSDVQGNILDLTTINGSITVQGEGEQVAINATANPEDAGTVTGAGMYELGSTATLMATANAGYMFQNWTENGNVVSSNAIYTFTVLNARDLVANFSEISGNVMSIANVMGEAGETVELSLNLDNVDDVVGFQTDIIFPAGVTLVQGSVELGARASNNHIIYANMMGENVLRVLVYSMPGTNFTGTSGAVATMEVVLGDIPGNYEVVLSDAAISDVQGNILDLTTINGIVTIESDANIYTVSAIISPANSGTIMGTGQYLEGTVATLTATPNAGYDFVNWTEDGVVVSTNQMYSFTVLRNHNLVANFEESPIFTVTATVNPANAGTVQGAGSYYYGEQVVMRATEAEGYDFVNWTENGVVVSTSSVYSFFIAADRDFVANFQLESYTVSLTANPFNGGIVSGAGLYHYGDVVTISAQAHDGYTFVRWEEDGDQVSTNANYVFEIEESHAFVAVFDINTYTITAEANDAAYGEVSGAGEYAHGTTVVMTAIPNAGYKFVSWTEDGVIVSSYSVMTFVAMEDRDLVANFDKIEGIEDMTAEDITVYPNPVMTSCVVECPAEMTDILVVAENGQVVRTIKNVSSNVCTIEMGDLSTGTYFIQIVAPQGNIVKKVVKL